MKDIIKKDGLIVMANIDDRPISFIKYQNNKEEKEVEVYNMEIILYVSVSFNDDIIKINANVNYAYTNKYKEYINICDKGSIIRECWILSIIDTKIISSKVDVLFKLWIITRKDRKDILDWIKEALISEAERIERWRSIYNSNK